MKILFDPIYTNHPHRCSTAAKFKKVAVTLLDRYPDLFIYWLVPDWMGGESEEWLPDTDRIRYIPYPYDRIDRIKEYYRFPMEMELLLGFNTELWDVDMVISTRTCQGAMFKYLMCKPGKKDQEWSKKVLMIEGFPLFEFKRTVNFGHRFAQTLQTLLGYLASDRVIMSSFWERAEVLREARAYLAPAQMKRLGEVITESCSHKADMLKLKSKASVQKMLDGERPFTLGFSGRLNVSKVKIYDVFKLMERNWVLGGKHGQVRCVMSTVSRGSGRVAYEGNSELPEWLEVMNPAREAFWDLFHNDVDVFIFLSYEEGYSMTVMEPIMLGCPAIVNRAKWSVSQLGEDYPFFITNAMEAYTLARAFQNDYPGMYKKFAVWFKKHLTPMLIEREQVYLPEMICREIDSFHLELMEYHKATTHLLDNNMLTILRKYIDGEFVLRDILAEGIKNKEFKSITPQSIDPLRERTKNPLGYGFNFNFFRLMFLNHFGYEDASVKVGHLKPRKKSKSQKKLVLKK